MSKKVKKDRPPKEARDADGCIREDWYQDGEGTWMPATGDAWYDFIEGDDDYSDSGDDLI